MIINGKNTNSYKKSSSKGLEYYQNLKQSPQTIQQKMDALWEEEKQPVSNQQSTTTNQAHQDDYRSRMNKDRNQRNRNQVSYHFSFFN